MKKETKMLKPLHQSMLFKGILLVGVMASSSCSDRYPMDVCSCSEIYHSNPYDIGLAKKKSGLVLLSPSVKLVKRISLDVIVVSNLKSQISNGPGQKYWDGTATEEGYFLHQCGGDPLLVLLGMDREKAIAKALELVEQSEKDARE
jgi:hypothetical protein